MGYLKAKGRRSLGNAFLVADVYREALSSIVITLPTPPQSLPHLYLILLMPKQGLTLARPEIVPFRLTPYMVDGMGLCGFEGVYRRVMETSISVLRNNRETLLSVLEPFLQARTGTVGIYG